MATYALSNARAKRVIKAVRKTGMFPLTYSDVIKCLAAEEVHRPHTQVGELIDEANQLGDHAMVWALGRMCAFQLQIRREEKQALRYALGPFVEDE